MRTVNQSAELVAITAPSSGTIAEFIERTGRICWRSDPKGEAVEFCRRLRPERRFASPQELKAEIQHNIQQTQDYFMENPE